MLSRINSPRDQLIFVLALKLGLRATEITALHLTDINWENKTVAFHGKRKKFAVLPLTDEVLGYMERALKVRPTNLFHTHLIWNTRNLNKGVSRFNIYYLIRKYGETVGIRLWPHLLRHKFGTDVMKKGDIYRGGPHPLDSRTAGLRWTP